MAKVFLWEFVLERVSKRENELKFQNLNRLKQEAKQWAFDYCHSYEKSEL